MAVSGLRQRAIGDFPVQDAFDFRISPGQRVSDHVQRLEVLISEGDISRIDRRMNLSQQLAFR